MVSLHTLIEGILAKKTFLLSNYLRKENTL